MFYISSPFYLDWHSKWILTCCLSVNSSATTYFDLSDRLECGNPWKYCLRDTHLDGNDNSNSRCYKKSFILASSCLNAPDQPEPETLYSLIKYKFSQEMSRGMIGNGGQKQQRVVNNRNFSLRTIISAVAAQLTESPTELPGSPDLHVPRSLPAQPEPPEPETRVSAAWIPPETYRCCEW